MSEFLAENNTCGQTLLNLVSKGNAIIAELLRLKDYIPKLFTTDSKAEIQKYQDIIMDFTYFNITESQEQKIDNNQTLRELDEEFRDNHIEIINRFYVLFESIHIYAMDLNQFIEDLEDGTYIHQSLETICADIEGKQILCESLYLYGLMLLLVDNYIIGAVREKLLVSYYRYTPQRSDTRSCIDDVCKLLRDTGLHNKKVSTYPEAYFKRIEINPTFVEIVIGRLRTDDIYGQLSVYPLPKHRSVALSNQAAMLYICLYFSTDILHNQTATMREIVDKYFPDNWVISIHMGHTVDITETWDNFKAAKSALNNTLDTVNLKNCAHVHGKNVPNLLKSTGKMLKEGHITKDGILKEMNTIVNLLRECNVTLRWLMLHILSKLGRNKRCKQIRDLVIAESQFDATGTFKLLLNTAQLELNVKELFKGILNEKQEQWTTLKAESLKNILELSEVFGGGKPLSRIKKNPNLERWFTEIARQIETLTIDDSNSSRKIVQLIQALEEVQEFHQLETDMQVVQYLSETRQGLDKMIQTMSVKEDNLINIQIIGDVSFAWELIDSFTEIMQQGIKQEPTLVIKLRAIFLKVASAMEIPLLRINQAHSEDLVSVSEYYSRELEIYVRKVLQIIPNMMFEKMDRIIEMQTSVLKELPTRLDKDKLKHYAQLDERFELAQLTHSISVFSQGMRMMKTTLVGVVCLDPKKMLEDGIRNELVRHISKALHSQLAFGQKTKNVTTSELELKINALVKIMDGYKRSFEYIQDYINVNGLKIWQEEVTRIVNYNVEIECNVFLRNKIHTWDSQYQNRIVPIPILPPTDGTSVNFIGRLAREIIRVTDPRNVLYIDQTTTWYETKSHKPVLNRQILSSLVRSIEIAGVVGLDRFFSFMIIANLEKIMDFLQNKSGKHANAQTIIATVRRDIKLNSNTANPNKFYQNCINRTSRLWNEFLDHILIVGQLQLLRKLINFHLNLSAKFNAKNLEASLRALNSAMLHDIKKNEDWILDEKFLYDLSRYFDYAGINNPFNKIYVQPIPDVDYAVTMFVFAISFFHRLFHPGPLGNMNKKNDHQIDGYSFCLGVHTVFKQFHEDIADDFIQCLANYVMEFAAYQRSTKGAEASIEAVNVINFLEVYCKFSESSVKSYRTHLPDELVHLELTFPLLTL